MSLQVVIKKVDKPPYRVPSMEEIKRIPKRGSVISTFSGCGGSSLGYKMAGFKVLWANEFIPAAQEVYRVNHPDTILDVRDIREIQPEEILKAIGLNAGELDLFDGSPPCASFSMAGKREKAWGQVKQYSDTKQRVDDLFFEYARLITGIQPKVFVAENVSGLVKGVAKGYFLEILQALKDCGYNVRAKVLDAQWLGVPQMRQRVIFIGVLNDLNLEPQFPEALPYQYSVRDAIPWINKVTIHAPTSTFKSTPTDYEISPAIMAGGIGGHNRSHYFVEAETDISKYAIGKNWDEIKPGQKHPKRFNLVKPAIDRPCNTIVQTMGNSAGKVKYAANVVHPLEKRYLSIAELKRICAFPDDFILTGTYAQQWERLGRSVPPVMMSHIAAAIRDKILKVLR